MDKQEIRNRTISAALSAFGAAATTAAFLYMFQDSQEVQKEARVSSGKSASEKGDTEGGSPPISLNGPIARGIPKVGDGSELFPDFIGGLSVMAKRARAATPTGLGWFDNMGQPILLLSNPEHARYVLSKVTAHSLWGGIKPASEAFFGKSVLFVLEGDEWKRLRQLLRDSFKTQRLDVLSKDVTSCAVQLSNRLQEFADAGKPVDMNLALSQFHLASIGKSSFDYDMDVMAKFPKPNDITESFEYLLQELPRRSFHPDDSVREDYVSNNEDNVKWQRAAKTVRNAVTKAIIQRLEDERRGGWTPRGDLLDSMIASYRAHETPETTTHDIKLKAEILMDSLGDNLVEVFFAGYNTSVVAMSVALYYLATNKDLMQEAHMEVDEAIPDDLSYESSLHAKQFPFLCRVFQEALRLIPPAPLVARATVSDLPIEGITIPPNTTIWIPAGFLHTDPQAWGSTADDFDPSRWEKPIIPGSFLPFSGGARDCIGKHFAELESVVAMAVLLKTYDFDIDPSFKFTPLFTGFGTRTANANNMTVSMNLIPRRRTDISAFIYDWTPGKIPRRNSNPLFAGLSDDDLPPAPVFN